VDVDAGLEEGCMMAGGNESDDDVELANIKNYFATADFISAAEENIIFPALFFGTSHGSPLSSSLCSHCKFDCTRDTTGKRDCVEIHLSTCCRCLRWHLFIWPNFLRGLMRIT
jgi:hypothetical protein